MITRNFPVKIELLLFSMGLQIFEVWKAGWGMKKIRNIFFFIRPLTRVCEWSLICWNKGFVWHGNNDILLSSPWHDFVILINFDDITRFQNSKVLSFSVSESLSLYCQECWFVEYLQPCYFPTWATYITSFMLWRFHLEMNYRPTAKMKCKIPV